MKIQLRIYLFICLFLFTGYDGYATHVMGGNLELKAKGKTPGNYKIILKLYIDLTSQSQVETNPDVEIRKTDNNFLVTHFKLDMVSSKPVIYENESCTEKGNLRTQLIYYEKDIMLDPSEYTDIKGYYLLWSDCCRNASISNIKNPAFTAIQFKTHFPSLIKSGKPFLDSSPSFNELDGTYLCIGEPFYFPFDATDADGDELRYSMQNPLGENGATGNSIEWASGYSAANAIPGSPALNIDAKTGELHVVPNRIGLFMFSVLVEEFRHGELIGSVHRDFQMNVVDCPPVAPPVTNVLIGNQLVTEISVCEGKTVLLNAAVTSNEWNYQWKMNGRNIAGANSPGIQVFESGEYQLITSLANTCSKSARSNIVRVNVTKSSFALNSKGPLQICEIGGSVLIEAPAGNNEIYHWFLNGSAIRNSTGSLTASKPGSYSATIAETPNGCTSASDTLIVTESESTAVTISAVDPMCGSDHKPVVLEGTPAGGIFSGHGVTGDIFDPGQAGTGTHEIQYTVSSAGSCPQDTARQFITVWDLPVANAGNNVSIPEGGTTYIGGLTTDEFRYNWTPPEGLDNATSARPLVSPLRNTLYTLQVTDSNGCTSTANVMVNLIKKVWLPDAFSPNGDGKNESWEIKGLEIYPEAEITIYNRWGEVVFFSKGYKTAFDGKLKGVLQPVGTYVYTIKLDAASSVSNGTLLLLR